MTFIKRKGRATLSVGKRGPRMSYRLGCAVPILAMLMVMALLVGCGGEEAVDRFADADTCPELFAAFEAYPVSDDPAERKEVGDEYRARFRELDCEL